MMRLRKSLDDICQGIHDAARTKNKEMRDCLLEEQIMYLDEIKEALSIFDQEEED